MPGENFVQLVELMRRLRAPGGCPWDRDQTFQTIKPYMLEEAYEVAEAIDNRDFPELREELGDLRTVDDLQKLAANSNKAPRMPRIPGEKYSTSVSLAKPFTEWWLR